jgi:hypothetical protein
MKEKEKEMKQGIQHQARGISTNQAGPQRQDQTASVSLAVLSPDSQSPPPVELCQQQPAASSQQPRPLVPPPTHSLPSGPRQIWQTGWHREKETGTVQLRRVTVTARRDLLDLDLVLLRPIFLLAGPSIPPSFPRPRSTSLDLATLPNPVVATLPRLLICFGHHHRPPAPGPRRSGYLIHSSTPQRLSSLFFPFPSLLPPTFLPPIPLITRRQQDALSFVVRVEGRSFLSSHSVLWIFVW